MKQDFRFIQLQTIEENSQYNIHPFLEDTHLDANLIDSIRNVGILSPPVIIKKTSGSYETVCGRRRIQCIRTSNATSCYCQILDQQCPAETILTTILEDQFATGQLTTIEQAWFIKISNQVLAEDKRLNSFFQSLLPGRITKGHHYLSHLVELEKSLQSAIHLGTMSEKIVSDLIHFSTNEQHLLLNLIESLHLGGNNQKKLIFQLRDILKREDISFETFIGRDGIREILLNHELDRGEKASRLLEYVRHIHQPLLTSAQNSFEQQIKTLKLPDRVAVIPSNSFEKDDVTLSVRFRSFESLKKKWKSLARYLND